MLLKVELTQKTFDNFTNIILLAHIRISEKVNMKDYKFVFKALSDDTRLRIMRLLLTEERLCVLEISEILGISQTASSRNLSILRMAGLLKDQRQGPCIYYFINKTDENCFTNDVLELLSIHITNDFNLLHNNKDLKAYNAEKGELI